MATTQQDLGFAQQVAEVIRAHVPEAQVILYGSRARGDAQPDSDWDVLIVTQDPVPKSDRQKAFEEIFDLQLEQDQCASVMWFDKTTWQDSCKAEPFFHSNVQNDGIRI